MSGSCLDLRQYQESDDLAKIMGKLVSGKSNYKAVIEKKKEALKCPNCGILIDEMWKFCPECGHKLK